MTTFLRRSDTGASYAERDRVPSGTYFTQATLRRFFDSFLFFPSGLRRDGFVTRSGSTSLDNPVDRNGSRGSESDCGPVGVIWESSVDRQAVDGRTDQLFWGGCPQEFKIM